jgi:DNA-binding NtrC family response regulator
MANILVVDDEIGIRELLSEILADEGHVVFAAENASVARSVRQAEALDLVLLDIWMPDTDGVTLLKEWAGNGLLTMPVLMMSGHATIDTAVEATRFGAMDFLEKPIALARLLSAVRTALDRNRMIGTLRQAPVEPAAVPVEVQPSEEPPPSSLHDRGLVAASPVGDEADGVNTVSLDQPLREARDHFERVYFEYHLEREHYSMTRVADRAGLERTHLYRKLKQLGIELSRGGRRADRGMHGPADAEGNDGDSPAAADAGSV